MARFVLHVGLDNAALEDPDELPRIFRELADAAGVRGFLEGHGYVTDANGNRVGWWRVEP